MCHILIYFSFFFKYISPKYKPVLEIKQLIIYHQSQEKLHHFWFTMADCQEVWFYPQAGSLRCDYAHNHH